MQEYSVLINLPNRDKGLYTNLIKKRCLELQWGSMESSVGLFDANAQLNSFVLVLRVSLLSPGREGGGA